jgi:hypothetical protein
MKKRGKMPLAVRVELTPLLRKYVQGYDPDEGLTLEGGEGKAVRQIIKELGIPSDKVFTVLINHLPSQPGYVLRDGDLVTLSRVLGAG